MIFFLQMKSLFHNFFVYLNPKNLYTYMKIAKKKERSQPEQIRALLKGKDYEKPAMLVVQLQHQSRLLQGSPQGNLGGPNTPQYEEWE